MEQRESGNIDICGSRLANLNVVLLPANQKGNGKKILASYTKLNHASKNGKVLKKTVGNTRLS